MAVNRQHISEDDDAWSCTFNLTGTVYDQVSDADGWSGNGSYTDNRTVLYLPEAVYRRCCTVWNQRLGTLRILIFLGGGADKAFSPYFVL